MAASPLRILAETPDSFEKHIRSILQRSAANPAFLKYGARVRGLRGRAASVSVSVPDVHWGGAGRDAGSSEELVNGAWLLRMRNRVLEGKDLGPGTVFRPAAWLRKVTRELCV